MSAAFFHTLKLLLISEFSVLVGSDQYKPLSSFRPYTSSTRTFCSSLHVKRSSPLPPNRALSTVSRYRYLANNVPIYCVALLAALSSFFDTLNFELILALRPISISSAFVVELPGELRSVNSAIHHAFSGPSRKCSCELFVLLRRQGLKDLHSGNESSLLLVFLCNCL